MNAAIRAAWPIWPDRVVSRFPLWRREALLIFPLGIIAVLTAHAAQITDVSDVLRWCVVAVIGATAGWVYIAVFSGPYLTLYRRASTDTAKALCVITAAAGVGITYAIAISVATRSIDLPDTEPLLWRLFATAVIFGWFGTVVTLSLDARTRLRSEHDHLMHDAIALEAARISTTAMIDDMRREVAQEVERALIAARDDIDHHIGDTQTKPDLARWEEVAATLRNTASETVRPLSRELWDFAPRDLRHPKAWSLVAFVISHQPLRPLAVCTIYVLGGISALLQRESPESAVVELIVGVAIIAIVMSIANTLMRKMPGLHSLIFVTAALFLQSFAIVNALRSGRNPSESLAGTFASVVAGLIVILATSTFGAVRTMTQQQLDTIAAQVDRQFIESTARSHALAETMREASAVMHGTVQSRLLACAIAVEEAGKNRDAEQFSLALSRARSELEHPLPIHARTAAATILEELERRRALWDGLCQVTYEVSPDLPALPAATVATCGRVVEEGISNAVRHGDARMVSIGITVPDTEPTTQSVVRITITDDGSGFPAAPDRTGLGLQMIAAVAVARSLTNIDGHARLVVDLPLA